MAEPDQHHLTQVPEDRRCTAISESTGQRCGKWALRDGSLCGKHAAVALRSQDESMAASGDGAPSGSTKPSDERDRDQVRKEMRRIMKSATSKDADKVAAARVLAGIDEIQTTAKAPEIEALDALSAAELEALVLAHL
jgi:hypothetical protein